MLTILIFNKILVSWSWEFLKIYIFRKRPIWSVEITSTANKKYRTFVNYLKSYFLKNKNSPESTERFQFYITDLSKIYGKDLGLWLANNLQTVSNTSERYFLLNSDQKNCIYDLYWHYEYTGSFLNKFAESMQKAEFILPTDRHQLALIRLRDKKVLFKSFLHYQNFLAFLAFVCVDCEPETLFLSALALKQQQDTTYEIASNLCCHTLLEDFSTNPKYSQIKQLKRPYVFTLDPKRLCGYHAMVDYKGKHFDPKPQGLCHINFQITFDVDKNYKNFLNLNSNQEQSVIPKEVVLDDFKEFLLSTDLTFDFSEEEFLLLESGLEELLENMIYTNKQNFLSYQKQLFYNIGYDSMINYIKEIIQALKKK